MGRSKDIVLNVLADVERYRSEMAKLPGYSEAEATKASLAMQKVFHRQAVRQLKDQERAASGATKAWTNMARNVQGILAVVGAIKSMKGLVDMRKNLADLTNQLGDTAAQTGASVETLNAFRVAAESSGEKLDKLVPGLRQFPKRLDEMSRGTGEARIAFERLGFSQEDARKGMEDIDGTLREVIKRMKEVPDIGNQATMATQLWGESGVVLNQVLGNNDIAAWVDVARSGVDVSEDAIRSNQRWQIVVSELQNRWKGFQQFFVDSGPHYAGTIEFVGSKMAGLAEVVKRSTELMSERIGDQVAFFALLGEGKWKQAAQAWGASIKRVASDFTELDRAFFEGERTFQRNVSIMSNQALAADGLARGLEETSDAQKKAAAAAVKHTAELAAQAREMAKLDALRAEIGSDRLTEDQRIVRSAGERFRKIDGFVQDGLLTALQAERLRNQASDRMTRDRITLAKSEAEEMKETWDAAQKAMTDATLAESEARKEAFVSETQFVGDQLAMLAESFGAVFEFLASQREADLADTLESVETKTSAHEDAAERVQDLADEEREIQRQLADATLEYNLRLELEKQLVQLQTEQAAESNRQSRLAGEILTSEAIADDQRTRLKNAMIASRAASIFQVGVATAVAVMTALAQLGPIAGAIAAGVVTAAGVTQAALIAAEPMPSFFGGSSGLPQTSGSAGEMSIRAHAGEGILNSGAMSQLGTGIVDALNAGMEPLQAFGGGGGDVVLDGQVVGRVLADQARNAGPLRDAIRNQEPVGFKSPWGRN